MPMINRIARKTKKLRLLRLFNGFDVRYHSKHLGEAMARKNEYSREYHHDKIYEAIRDICSKKKIKQSDLCLIEVELNDHINALVQAAYRNEAQKLKTREFVETRIKIKRVDEQAIS